MKTYAELRALAVKAWRTSLAAPDVAGVILLWQRDEPAAQTIIHGEVEDQRDVPRLLREMADKLEATKEKLVV